ncbi:MAG: hypothetical protein O3C60_19760 [Planctomycetota bacterium]|nr:hypothetical protein [Planctomycetota bacterium]
MSDATDATRRLVMCSVTRYSLADDELMVFFSGRKGFHVGLPIGVFGDAAAPSVGFHGVSRRVAETIAGAIVIDPAIYGKTQPFRAPNSRHGKTGLHKRRISIDELMTMKPEAIAELAQVPLPFDALPTATGNEVAANDWRNAMESYARMTKARLEQQAGPAKLNALTMEFIRNGASTGDRHRLLYSAAANLREFGCSFELAYALLNESALDSGLAPREVTRQIRCGIEVTS